eukprot:6176659-Pleurochrysis_carterae.AAC.1
MRATGHVGAQEAKLRSGAHPRAHADAVLPHANARQRTLDLTRAHAGSKPAFALFATILRRCPQKFL